LKTRALLLNGLIDIQISPTDEILSKFEIFLFELKKWNKTYNLTALKSDEDIVIKHFLDSLLYLRLIPDKPFYICDIGSGAGFPGVPIAIVRSDLKIDLIEPSRKKTAFLRHLKRILSINNIEVLEKRVEDVSEGIYDIALTRALFTIKELIIKARHVLKKDGYFIISKGPKFEDELKTFLENINIEIFPAKLPLTTIERYLIKISLP
jgi:16S rRNA (guanine527-N7)-methyltransferase